MDLMTGFIVYGVLWWLVFLIAMAAQRTSNNPKSHFLRRIAVTTAASGALWCMIALILFFDLVGFKEGGV